MARHPSKPTARRAERGADLEEIRPGQFLVRDVRAQPILKTEGKLEGRQFTLTSWRRDGLLARLRNNGFRVQTLEDRVKALPSLPPAPPLGAQVTRVGGSIDRFSHFDPLALAWIPLDVDEGSAEKQLTLRAGWIVRRRKGRGAASYHRIFAERGGSAGLVLLDETSALLEGFAQAQTIHRTPLHGQRQDRHHFLPDIELPPPHRALLARIGEQSNAGLRFDERGWVLARAVFARLGLVLV